MSVRQIAVVRVRSNEVKVAGRQVAIIGGLQQTLFCFPDTTSSKRMGKHSVPLAQALI